jgi:hypothetical protein
MARPEFHTFLLVGANLCTPSHLLVGANLRTLSPPCSFSLFNGVIHQTLDGVSIATLHGSANLDDFSCWRFFMCMSTTFIVSPSYINTSWSYDSILSPPFNLQVDADYGTTSTLFYTESLDHGYHSIHVLSAVWPTAWETISASSDGEISPNNQICGFLDFQIRYDKCVLYDLCHLWILV